MQNKRLLTVGSKHNEHGLYYEKLPYIRLCGKWLEAAGFNVGDLISVEPQNDGLLIRRMDRLQLIADSSKNKTGPSGKNRMHEIAKRAPMTLPETVKARRRFRS